MQKAEFELPDEDSLLLKETAPEFYFRLFDGRQLKSVSELLTALKDMSDYVFYHHVNAERNDFSAWIRDIFWDYRIAHKVQQARTRQELISVLEKELIREQLTRQNEQTKEKIKINKAIVKVQRRGSKKKVKAKPRQFKITPALKIARKPIMPIIKREQPLLVQQEHKQLPSPEIIKMKEIEQQLIHKLEEVLRREKDIQLQEQKIREIEERLNKQLESAKAGTAGIIQQDEQKFLAKEFLQGLATGMLLAVIGSILYIRFFKQAG